MILLSSALRAGLATEYGLARMMRYGCIRVFSGPQPDSPDDAEKGIYLGSITQGGAPFAPGFTSGGLQIKSGPVAGACQNDGTWALNVENSGTAGWWRFIWNDGDAGTGAEYTPRVDGLVGEGLILPSTALTAASVIPLDSFFFFLTPTN